MKRKLICAAMAASLFVGTLPAFAERNEDETIQLEGDTYSYTSEDSLTEQFEEYNVAYESTNDNILDDYALSIDFDGGEEYAMVTPSISYQAHVADIGWQSAVTSTSSSVKTAGTTGQAKQMEALKITLNNESGQSMIKYQAHVSNIGWQGWKNSGEIAGTTGRSLAIEAFQIKLNSPYSNSYDVLYRVHTANKGWLEWAKNGETAGSTGMALRIEAIEIKIVDKNSVHTSSEKASLIKPSLSYRTHVSNKGWLASVKEGATSGTTGEALQMEALQISLNDFDNKAAISYRAHVSNIGWQAWKNSGETAGTTGQSLAIEAVEIKLSDSLTPFFDVYYRLHCKDYGWLGWAKNGETAGTTGGALRSEAIEIQLVAKDAAFNKGGAAYVDASKKTAPATASNKGQDIVNTAKNYIGVPYLWGGTTPKGFDCSGFVQYVCAQNGIKVNRVAADQRKNGTYVSRANLQPGDLVFFSNGGKISHVGIYVGNEQMIHAPSPGKTIQIVSMNTSYWNARYNSAVRVY